MQPVLSVARQMLLGVRPFDESALNAEADNARADVLSNAAFEETDERPPVGKAPGVTIEDFVRAHFLLERGVETDWHGERRVLASTAAQLSQDDAAIPLSPFVSDVRRIAHDLVQTGERAPLVLGSAERGAFRSVVAAWASSDGIEFVDRAERLEALLGMWNGETVSEDAWREAHALACCEALTKIDGMEARASGEERVALERQVAAARERLLRGLARFLAAAAADDEDFNTAFHRAMMRGGQIGALLTRAHSLMGYPEWPPNVEQAARESVQRMGANQRTNLLLGTPLEAAVRDPRWSARTTLDKWGTV